MYRGNARSPNTVGRQICKKVVPQLNDPGANILVFHCDTSRTTEATSTRKTLWARFFDDTSFVVLKAYLRCRARKKTNLLQNSGFIKRPVEREQNAAENSFCIQNSTISKTFKKCRQKNLNMFFWGPERKGVFIIFRLRRPIPPVPYNEKICN